MTTRVEYGVPFGNDFVNPNKKMPVTVKSGRSYVFYPIGSAVSRILGGPYYRVEVEDRRPNHVTLVHLESNVEIRHSLYENTLPLLPGGDRSRTLSGKAGFRVTDVQG